MARQEFPAKIRVAIIRRAERDGQVYCEQCSCLAKRFQVDHIIADALKVDKSKPLTAEDGQLLCEPCFSVKNPDDTRAVAKAKRNEASHLRARVAPARPIASAPMATTPKAAARQAKPKMTQLPEIFRRVRGIDQ